jgi:sulfur-oxidizing protein SoxY
MSDHCRSPVEPLSLIRVVSRRNFVLGGAAAVSVAMMLRAGAVAAGEDTSQPTADVAAPAEEAAAGRIPVSSGLTHSRQFDEALQAILADAEPVVGEPLTLELPELAENGNVVPYTVAVESPMTDTDYVRTLHLLSTSNPQPVVAAFHLVPATGKASVSGRMRLAKTQDVVAIAEVSTGQVLVAVRKVEVTIGGCGTE